MSNKSVSQRFPHFALSDIRIFPLSKFLILIVLGIVISAGTVPTTALATDAQGPMTGMTETVGIAIATVTSEEPSSKSTYETDNAQRGQKDEQEGDEGKDRFSPADAIVLSVLIVAISLVLRSMMRMRMRSCPGSCSLCMARCHKAARLDEDPILRKKLEMLRHSTNRGDE